MAFSVRDQLDRHLVCARVSGQRPGCELGQLLVIAFREIGPDLPNVLLDDVEIVEQPVSGRTDVEAVLRSLVQLLVDPVENSSRVFESEQKGPDAANPTLDRRLRTGLLAAVALTALFASVLGV